MVRWERGGARPGWRAHVLEAVGYEEGVALQREAAERVLAGGEEEVFFLEHLPVITCGKRGGDIDEVQVRALEIPVVKTDRGGLATWHGPGQLVIYPILNIQKRGLGARQWTQQLGEMMLALGKAAGVKGLVYDPERPGVYREGRKIGSIGLHLSRGISTHGLALNVCNRLDGFCAISPCGYAGQAISTLQAELGEAGPPLEVAPLISLAQQEVQRRFF